MEYYCIGHYHSFQCLAENCPDTCCTGWNIFVGQEDYERFCRMGQQDLRKDILSHIIKKDGKYYFRNRADGRCKMLDDDGLCRIQKGSSEKALCNTCRKYPRLFYQRQEVFYLSMAASCPVISKALWKNEISFSRVGQDGRMHGITCRQIPVSRSVWEYYDSVKERASVYRKKIAREELFSDSMGNLFELPAGLLGELPVTWRSAWEELLLFYSSISEAETERKLICFFSDYGQLWSRYTDTYLAYRFVSRQAMTDEMPEETFCRSMGEVFLVQASCFLEFCRHGMLPEETVCGWIRKMYRFCANGGQTQEEKIRQKFNCFYREKSLWCILLPGETENRDQCG